MTRFTNIKVPALRTVLGGVLGAAALFGALTVLPANAQVPSAKADDVCVGPVNVGYPGNGTNVDVGCYNNSGPIYWQGGDDLYGGPQPVYQQREPFEADWKFVPPGRNPDFPDRGAFPLRTDTRFGTIWVRFTSQPGYEARAIDTGGPLPEVMWFPLR